jgi:hypothetical protein
MSTLIPPNEAIEVSLFWTWMGDDGICRTKTKPNAEINVKEAVENSQAVSSFYRGKKYPLLIDSRDIKSIAREARKHFAISDRETRITSFALIVKSPLSRVIGNFFMGLNKPSVPARLFDSEKEALKWLRQYL